MHIARKEVRGTARVALCILACALLAGCFFIPGHFQSELDIRRDGSFAYSYIGEIVFIMPPDEMPQTQGWDDSMAECVGGENAELRSCTSAEIAEKRSAYESDVKQRRDSGDNLAALIGYDPLDRKANERLAAELMEYPGWRQARYLGNGTFHVEYAMRGNLERDFAFPVIPQIQMAMPFINISRNKTGAANISVAGLSSQQFRSLLIGQTPKRDRDDPYFTGTQSVLDRTNGVFTITTDASVTETDGNQSQAGDLKRIEWTINSKMRETPKIRLALDPPT